jgi:hypothetical protein
LLKIEYDLWKNLWGEQVPRRKRLWAMRLIYAFIIEKICEYRAFMGMDNPILRYPRMLIDVKLFV